MANMSYCRFQNTLEDLGDCEEVMGDDSNELSEAENKAKKRLIERCIRIAMNFGPTDVSNALFALSKDELKVH